MSKVLVLGGTRFFGKRLVSLLLDAGHEVTVMTRGNQKDTFGDRVKRITGDRTKPEDLQRAANEEEWDLVYDNICYSQKAALEACRIFKGRVKRYIFTSTLSVYGYGSKMKEGEFDPYEYKLIEEEQEVSYGEGKRLAEAAFFQRAQFPVCAVRFPIVLGEDDYTQRLHFHIRSILKGKQIGVPNMEAKMSFINSDEAARFLFWTGERQAAGPMNACSHGEITLADLVKEIESATGNKANVTVQAPDEQMSPYGVENSWYMDHSKAASQGFEFDELSEWLPALILKLTAIESAASSS
ncbi:NAD-dependent epimerase/dehydratase family protein [Peribacillus kribbensis]|uniref:NAD-dependent epimerase/dehydratase family protein n=1 Tax=Peribacillus kribbensis TaxID=356658 RepID=UPI0003F7D7FA|nr:NAD-dependent epimerase/dehydratase family protein [Peribacillus kribbensis]